MVNAAVNSPTASSRCSGCGASNADKPNQFKLTGMYLLPWQDIIVSANYSGVSGPAVTRQITRALAIGSSQTINLEPLGSRRNWPAVIPLALVSDLTEVSVFAAASVRYRTLLL